MKVISTNLARPKTIQWDGKNFSTGIFKKPVNKPLQLGLEIVAGDCIANREVHGGVEKACYLYGHNHYPFWKSRYPDLDWTYGMLGENLTIDQLEEAEVLIGDIYKLGTATVQISRPRQPCFKFAAKFQDKAVIKLMIEEMLMGTYVRVLEPGQVQTGDELKLIETRAGNISIQLLTEVMFHYDPVKHADLAQAILGNELVSDSDKKYVRGKMK